MLTPLITIALAGLVVWAIAHFVPMPAKFRQVLWAVAGVLLFAYLRQTGILGSLGIPAVIVDVVSAIAMTGLFVWAVTLLVPMPEKFKVAIYVAAGVLLLLWLLGRFGIWHGFHHLH